jgi:hypothetical protein
MLRFDAVDLIEQLADLRVDAQERVCFFGVDSLDDKTSIDEDLVSNLQASLLRGLTPRRVPVSSG